MIITDAQIQEINDKFDNIDQGDSVVFLFDVYPDGTVNIDADMDVVTIVKLANILTEVLGVQE